MQTNIFLAVAAIAMLCPPLYSEIEGDIHLIATLAHWMRIHLNIFELRYTALDLYFLTVLWT